MDEKLDKTLIDVISKIAARYGCKAVLKGGMALRLQGIPRWTVDADFVFQPHRSRKEFKDELVAFLTTICDEPPRISLDSKKFQIVCKKGGVECLLEATAALHVPFEKISTGNLAATHGLEPCVVAVMAGPHAYSNKLGAWLERRLSRDLYDIYIYQEILRVRPDLDLLHARISNPQYSNRVAPKPALKSIPEFCVFLHAQTDSLSSHTIESDLQGIVEDRHLAGLGTRILSCIRLMHFG